MLKRMSLSYVVSLRTGHHFLFPSLLATGTRTSFLDSEMLGCNGLYVLEDSLHVVPMYFRLRRRVQRLRCSHVSVLHDGA